MYIVPLDQLDLQFFYLDPPQPQFRLSIKDNVLRRDDLFAESTAPVKHDYYTTGEAKKFTEITRQWMNDDTIVGHHVDAED